MKNKFEDCVGSVVILVIGCMKYIKDIKTQIVSLNNLFPYTVVGIVGGAASNNFNDATAIFYSTVDDTYEMLPNKVRQGIRFILNRFPDVKKIIKIDDDINIINPEDIGKIIRALPDKLCYAGCKIGSTLHHTSLSVERRSKCTGSTYSPRLPTNTIYVYGGLYILSVDLMQRVADCPDKYYDSATGCILEDVTLGMIMKNHGIIPVIIPINIQERDRTYHKTLTA